MDETQLQEPTVEAEPTAEPKKEIRITSATAKPVQAYVLTSGFYLVIHNQNLVNPVTLTMSLESDVVGVVFAENSKALTPDSFENNLLTYIYTPTAEYSVFYIAVMNNQDTANLILETKQEPIAPETTEPETIEPEITVTEESATTDVPAESKTPAENTEKPAEQTEQVEEQPTEQLPQGEAAEQAAKETQSAGEETQMNGELEGQNNEASVEAEAEVPAADEQMSEDAAISDDAAEATGETAEEENQEKDPEEEQEDEDEYAVILHSTLDDVDYIFVGEEIKLEIELIGYKMENVNRIIWQYAETENDTFHTVLDNKTIVDEQDLSLTYLAAKDNTHYIWQVLIDVDR